MKKALRKVARAGKAPKVEKDYAEESETSETESEIEDDHDHVEGERTSQPWETIIRDKR